MARGSSPSLRAQWLGRELRNLREAKGLKPTEVGELLGKTDRTVGAYERGTYAISESYLEEMLDIYDVVDPSELQRLKQLALDVRERGWWDGYKPHLNNTFADYLWLENTATKIQGFCLTYLDGLLQTQDYAESLVKMGPERHDPMMVKRIVEARVIRSGVLDKSKTTFEFLISETVLDVEIGDPKIMSTQLAHLIRIMDNPQVQIKILPRTVGTHIAASIATGFTHFTLEAPMPNVAYIETSGGGLYIESPAVDSHQDLFANLWNNDALSDKQSIATIKARIENKNHG